MKGKWTIGVLVRIRDKSGKEKGLSSDEVHEEKEESMPGCGSIDSSDEGGSVSDAESTSDTLAYEGGIGNGRIKRKTRRGV